MIKKIKSTGIILPRIFKLTRKVKVSPRISLLIGIVFIIPVLLLIISINEKIVPSLIPLPDEPEAPLSVDLQITPYEASISGPDFSQSNSSTISESISEVPSTTPETYLDKGENLLSQERISQVRYVEDIKYSTDNKILVMSWNTDPSSFKNGDPAVTVTPTLKLSLYSPEGLLIKVIENEDVLNAEFFSEDQIYYQKLGDDYGLFSYRIKSDTYNKFYESSDSNAFKNIALIDENTFFFVQPKTGKYGHGNISTGELIVEGQSAIENETIMDLNVSTYSDLTITPDKKTIALYDNSVNKEFERTLKFFAVSDSKLENPIATYTVEHLLNNEGSLDKDFELSSDGKLLSTGTDSTTINLESKEVIFKGEKGKYSSVAFSPDGSKVISCEKNFRDGKCLLKNMKTEEGDIELPKNISQVGWVDNNNAVFTLGKSLYNFKVSQQLVEKVTEKRSDYKILSKEGDKQSLVIQEGDDLFKIATR